MIWKGNANSPFLIKCIIETIAILRSHNDCDWANSITFAFSSSNRFFNSFFVIFFCGFAPLTPFVFFDFFVVFVFVFFDDVNIFSTFVFCNFFSETWLFACKSDSWIDAIDVIPVTADNPVISVNCDMPVIPVISSIDWMVWIPVTFPIVCKFGGIFGWRFEDKFVWMFCWIFDCKLAMFSIVGTDCNSIFGWGV